MSVPDFDPETLSVEERLALIDRLWLSIAKDAQQGVSSASAALDLNRPLEAELVAELHQRVEAFKRDPSKSIRWEDLRAELRREVRVKLPVVIGAAAAAELRDHLARVAKDSPTTARHLNEELGTTFDLISEFPQLYERFDGDLRRAVLKRWSLGIFYERLADTIFVAAIVDLRRDPAAIRRRLGLHESAAEFLADPASSAPTLA